MVAEGGAEEEGRGVGNSVSEMARARQTLGPRMWRNNLAIEIQKGVLESEEDQRDVIRMWTGGISDISLVCAILHESGIRVPETHNYHASIYVPILVEWVDYTWNSPKNLLSIVLGRIHRHHHRRRSVSSSSSSSSMAELEKVARHLMRVMEVSLTLALTWTATRPIPNWCIDRFRILTPTHSMGTLGIMLMVENASGALSKRAQRQLIQEVRCCAFLCTGKRAQSEIVQCWTFNMLHDISTVHMMVTTLAPNGSGKIPILIVPDDMDHFPIESPSPKGKWTDAHSAVLASWFVQFVQNSRDLFERAQHLYGQKIVRDDRARTREIERMIIWTYLYLHRTDQL